eukprot:GHVU01103537.1.p1 GENE.GHVU01103537.1~~GHVU01103537.1.p1  ORF type:complete len:221 (-),score=2.96 GHVU01103537.1:89-751(-)
MSVFVYCRRSSLSLRRGEGSRSKRVASVRLSPRLVDSAATPIRRRLPEGVQPHASSGESIPRRVGTHGPELLATTAPAANGRPKAKAKARGKAKAFARVSTQTGIIALPVDDSRLRRHRQSCEEQGVPAGEFHLGFSPYTVAVLIDSGERRPRTQPVPTSSSQVLQRDPHRLLHAVNPRQHSGGVSLPDPQPPAEGHTQGLPVSIMCACVSTRVCLHLCV